MSSIYATNSARCADNGASADDETPLQVSEEALALDVAIVGMAGRFPGAANLSEVWANLCNGVESVNFFSDEELLKLGVNEALLRKNNYVKAAPTLDNVAGFDAGFFNFSPGEAQLLDPQRRLFFECGWEALEDAGYNPYAYKGAIGVYAGAGFNGYLIYNIANSSQLGTKFDEQQVLISSDKDHLPTHLSYKLNLSGPSINVNTACSSSLVAVHLAKQALLLSECDMALAGGSSIMVPHHAGYLYTEDSILSPDGHCRPFDEKAKGTLWGSGCGAILIKPLDAAIRDRDHIYAVIKGTAINNDGSEKVGYTAPSVSGQSNVVAQCLSASGITADTISYVEAHGTGTMMGDPIEIESLTEAFREDTDDIQYCAVGSVKSNMGHLGAAAGIVSLIKTALALQHKQIPPSINYDVPNPKCNFEQSPFYVNNRLSPWQTRNGAPRRAGISSLAVGGTNAHVILEEFDSARLAVKPLPQANVKPIHAHNLSQHFLTISARTASALENSIKQLLAFIREHPALDIADVEYTLQCGRRHFAHRVLIACQSLPDAIDKLDNVPQRITAENMSSTLHASPADLQTRLQEWLAGNDVDFENYFIGQPCRRISLPTYPFERQDYWINPDYSRGEDSAAPVDTVFVKWPKLSQMTYIPSWKHVPLPPIDPAKYTAKKTRWVFLAAEQTAHAVAAKLEATGDTIVYITPASGFYQLRPNNYTVNPADDKSYMALIKVLKAQGLLPDSILHFWNLGTIEEPASSPTRMQRAFQRKLFNPGLISTVLQHPAMVASFTAFYKFLDKPMPDHPMRAFSQSLNPNFYSLLYLSWALVRNDIIDDIELTVFANGLYEITGDEELSPERSMVIGQSIVTQQEYLNLSCRVVDVPLLAPGSNEHRILVKNLVEDVWRSPGDMHTAYRGGRMIQTYLHLPVEKSQPDMVPIEKGGLYFMHNGLIGIGKEIARYMLERKGAKVIFTSDFFFPEQHEWDSWFKDKDNDPEGPIGWRIKGAKELIDAGGVFLGPLTDVYEKDKLLAKIAEAEKKWGPVRGIVQAAGANSSGLVQFISDTDRGLCDYQILNMAYSLHVVDDLFKDRTLDFRVILSSLGSVLGAQGYAAYAGCGSYSGNFAYRHNRRNPDQPWKIQCWDSVDIEWDTVDSGLKDIVDLVTDKLLPVALTMDECAEIFERSFTLPEVTRLVISSTDLHARYNRWVKLENYRGEMADPNKAERNDLHERPNLDTEFVAPRDEIEGKVAKVFANALGIREVGIHDDFFELGGHSLLSTQLAADLREVFRKDVSIMTIIESPTVAGMTAAILESA